MGCHLFELQSLKSQKEQSRAHWDAEDTEPPGSCLSSHPTGLLSNTLLTNPGSVNLD